MPGRNAAHTTRGMRLAWRSRMAARGAGAGAGRRLAHPVQQIFQDHGVVVLLVLGGEQERKILFPAGQAVKFIESFRRLGQRQFLEVAFAEGQPAFGAGVKPVAQFVRGSKVAQPGVQRGLALAESARPQPVHQNAIAIAARGLLIDSFDGDAFAGGGHGQCSTIVLRRRVLWIGEARISVSRNE